MSDASRVMNRERLAVHVVLRGVRFFFAPATCGRPRRPVSAPRGGSADCRRKGVVPQHLKGKPLLNCGAGWVAAPCGRETVRVAAR